MAVEDSGSSGTAAHSPLPRLLADTAQLVSLGGDAPAGALWKLAEPGRQLDANVVRLPAGGRVDPHTEPDLDVLLLVLDGEARLDSADGGHPLRAGVLTWLCQLSLTQRHLCNGV
ncbi:hypothetical protein [Streptomyces ardesiacus]|uniref:hypothetical protein n=1 Tax=Streptomyces ardesiacus TaxID=285564 RepID=UPI0036398F28